MTDTTVDRHSRRASHASTNYHDSAYNTTFGSRRPSAQRQQCDCYSHTYHELSVENKQDAKRQAAKSRGVSESHIYDEEELDTMTTNFMARRDGHIHRYDSNIPAEQTGVSFSLSYQDRGNGYSDHEARYPSAPVSRDHQQGTASRSWTGRSHYPPRLRSEMSIPNATQFRRRGDHQEGDAGYNDMMRRLLPQLQDRHGHSLLANNSPVPFDRKSCDHYSDSESEDSSSDSSDSYMGDMDPLNQVTVSYPQDSGCVETVYYYPRY